MAELTYTVTVASGNLYGGGTGNVFYLDGSRNSTGPGTVSWVNGGTLRFDQSASSNDNHPLIFSTTTSRDQYLTSGVTYYLDGASNYANYVNTTNFNAATTRYVEVTPSSETDFYYLCYVHGIGMGGIFDITQTTWGAKTWGFNSWNNQDGIDVSPTAVTLASSLGTLNAFNEKGWGRDAWGDENWGESTIDVVLTGLDLSVSSGEENTWGQNTWNDPFIKWGGTYNPVVRIGQQIAETGEQLASTTGSVSVTSATEIFLSENPLSALNVSSGSVADRTEVFPTGQQLTASLGTEEAYNEQGWGRDAWGEEVWGAEGEWINVNVTGVTATTSLGNEDTEGNVTVELNAVSTPGWGVNLGWGDQLWGSASVNIGMSMSTGQVDPAPDVAITGELLNSTTGSLSVTANADLTLTGQGLTISLGNEDATPNTQVDLTGIQLNFTVANAVAGASALCLPTGVTATTSTGIISVNAWELVDSGTAPTWKLVA